ncbi:zinc-finger protein CreA/MIG [Microdochium nivale]|nr:zinc-finger protein CreA/MIG [Microdochium nivale]
MQARDATGRAVSLLNDDSSAQQRPTYTSRYLSVADRSPLQRTPELLRSDSYDSSSSGYDAISPLTPGLFDYASRPVYEDYTGDKGSVLNRPAYVESSRSNSYDDEASQTGPAPERAGKRYPCRYRDSHGCEKTFTTSGHASRHSKIHTAEKAVQCTFTGCNKKFTRADNMKQHLETHFKDKSRSSGVSKASKTSSAKRASISSKSSSSSHSNSSKDSPDVHMWDVEEYGHEQQPLPSFSATWDVRGSHDALFSRPYSIRTSSGLDALAAIACQESA